MNTFRTIFITTILAVVASSCDNDPGINIPEDAQVLHGTTRANRVQKNGSFYVLVTPNAVVQRSLQLTLFSQRPLRGQVIYRSTM